MLCIKFIHLKNHLITFSNEAKLKYDNCWKGIKMFFVVVNAAIHEFLIFIIANLFSVSLEALVTNKTSTTHNPATSKPASEEETN